MTSDTTTTQDSGTAARPMKFIPPLVAEFGLDDVRDVARDHLFDVDGGDGRTTVCRACPKMFERDKRGRIPHFALTSHAKKHYRANEALDIYIEDQALATGWTSARIMPKREDVERNVAERRAARIRAPKITELSKRLKPIERELSKIEGERMTAESAIVQMVRQDRADVPEFAERCKDVRNAGKQIKALKAKIDEIANEYDEDVRRAAARAAR